MSATCLRQNARPSSRSKPARKFTEAPCATASTRMSASSARRASASAASSSRIEASARVSMFWRMLGPAENDRIADRARRRIAELDRLAEPHEETIARLQPDGLAAKIKLENAVQRPDMLILAGDPVIGEGDAGAGRKFDLDDVNGGAGRGRRDVAPLIAACRIAPDRLLGASGKRARRLVALGEKLRQRDP